MELPPPDRASGPTTLVACWAATFNQLQSGERAAMPGAMVKGLFECLTCGSDELEAVSDGELTNFLCPACWSCWHVELGWIYRIDPSTRPGCQHLDECLSRPTASG